MKEDLKGKERAVPPGIEIPGIPARKLVMDLYLDDAGQPHVIELNPQSNSGLYALDMDALLTAIRDNPEQFMPDPSRGGMPGCLGVREEDSICFFQIPTGNH